MIDSLIYADKKELAYLLKKLILAYKKVYNKENSSKRAKLLKKLFLIEKELKMIHLKDAKELNKKVAVLKKNIEKLPK
jgi:hypothetical protein